ncbi:g6386 [Coccomyxa elongata]
MKKRSAAATSCETEHDNPQNDRAAQDQAEEAKDTSLRAAQQIAAQARQKCDMLKGPPRSSREDPDFQANYFAASRLHFIGSWKARIEALAVSMANDAPKASAPARGSSRAIIHIDMDCFFASVAALGEPALQGKPLCVSHSASSKGAGEVSSANYEARAFGVGAGMFISEAKRLCPDIIVMPYFFEKYEAISEKVYRILMQQTSSVQPLSCDEAFIDVTGLGDPEAIARQLRAQIEAETGCTASAGIGPNMLLARLATKRAKPNGQFHINPIQADEELLKLKAEDLPGVGWAMREKLKALGITTVVDVRNSRVAMLQHELGTKSGTLVWDYAHGRDERAVAPSQLRKSVGAEINYAVRLDTVGDADKFVDELAGELYDRMLKAGVKGRTITLKVKRKKTGAPEPIKFLGHGHCDNHSRSVTLPRFVGSRQVLAKTGKELLRAMNIPAPEIRGLGLTMTKLDNDPASSTARPSAAAPAKGAVAPPSAYDPGAPNPFAAFYELPAVKAAMPPTKERPSSSSGTVASRPAASRSPQALHGPLAGLLLRRSSITGTADTLERGQQGSGDANGASLSEHEADGSGADAPAAGLLAAEDAAHISLAGERQNTVDDQATAAETGDSMSEAGSLREEAIEDMGGCGGMDEEAAVHELRSCIDGQLEDEHLDAEVGSEQPSAGTEVAGPDEDAAVGGLHEVPRVSLSQMDAQVWAELQPELQQQLLQGMSGAKDLPPITDPRNKGAKGTPIQALPPASQIDVAVLDALPLQLKRELERAYGVDVVKSPPHKRRRGGAVSLAGRVLKRQRPLTEAFQSPPKARVAVGGLTMTQIDPAVLAELPPEMVAELVAGLPPSHEPFTKQGNLSPSTSETDGGSHAADDGDPNGRLPHIATRRHQPKRLRQKQLGPTEDVRQVWSALSSVLEELGQSCGSTHACQGAASDSPGHAQALVRIINSQYEPESFATAYKNVAGYGDEEDAAGSALQKGDNGAPDIGSGIVVLFSAVPQSPQDVLTFLELDGEATDMARADTGEMFWAATRPGVSKIFGSMDLQPCWVDTGASTTAVPQGEGAEYWRAGVKDRQAPHGRFRYGIIQAHVDGTYEIRYDDGKGHDDVDPARCEVDWVQPDAHKLATAARKGTVEERAKEIKKGRKMEEKAAKKAAKRAQRQPGVKVTQPKALPEQVGYAGDIVHQHLLACENVLETLEGATRYRDEHLASCSYTELNMADVLKIEKRAGAVVRDALQGLMRFEAAEIQEAGRGTNMAPMRFKSTPGRVAEGAAPKLVAALGVLGGSLLLGWEDIHAKHPNHRKETAGQKNARRDEQLLQLLLRMHILARLEPKSDAGLTKRQKLGVVELFDQLGISLIGESVSAADVYNAVLQPCFGAALPSLMEPLAESCGQAEASLPSIPSPGTQVTGSFARHSHNSECCDSISPVDTSTVNARESSYGNRPRDYAPSSSFLSGSHSACQTAQGSRDVRQSRPVASNLLGKQKNGRTAVDRMASRSRLAPVAKDPRALAKISIADMQHKRRHRSHRTGKRPGSGAVRGKPVLPPSQPNSTTPEAQRTNADGSTMMTPQSRRKATPDEDIDLECIPETELKGASDMVSADVASRPLMRQPVFGMIPVNDDQQLASCPNAEEELPPAQTGTRILQDAGVRQPLAQATWLFPAQNKRANNQSKPQPQVLKPPLQPPSHVGLLEQLDLTVVAAEKTAPASPSQHHKTAQHDEAALPHTAVVAAEPQQSFEHLPSADLGNTIEGMDTVGGGDAMDGLELPAAEASTGHVHLEEEPAIAHEQNSRGEPDGVPAEDGAAVVDGSVLFHMSGEETRVMPEPTRPPPSTGHECAAAAQRDPYEFDPVMDAASDRSVALQQHFKAVSSRPARAAGSKEGRTLGPRAAAMAQDDVSVSQGNSGFMMPDAGHALTQVANMVQQMSSEASPSDHSRDAEAACTQGGADRLLASCQQQSSQDATDAQGHASGVALESRHCVQPHTVRKRQQQPKKRGRKEDADVNAAKAACGTACPQSAKAVTIDVGPRTRSRAADKAEAARPATRSRNQPVILPSPPASRDAKRGRAQPQHAAPTPKRLAQQRQPQRSPEPAAGTEDEAAPPELSTVEIPQRPQRERRLSTKYGSDYVSSLPPCILNGAAAAGDPSSGPGSLQGSMHHAQTPQAGALAERSLGDDRNASAGPLEAFPVRSNSSLRHDAATEGTGLWEDILAADTPAGTSDARVEERPRGLETVQEEPEELPCSVDPPVLEQPAAATCAQRRIPPEHLLKRSTRVAQKMLGVQFSPEFRSLPSPPWPPRRAHTTPSTAPAGCAPMPAAAAELTTPSAFRRQQMRAATERVMQRKRPAPGSIGRCAAKRKKSMSSWRTDQTEQSGGGEPEIGVTPSGVLQERRSTRNRGQKKEEQLHQQPGKHGTAQGNSASAEQVPESAAPYEMRKVRTPSCRLQERS